MDIEQALVAHLLADQNLTYIVHDRIFPLVIPQEDKKIYPNGVIPGITYQRVSTPRSLSLSGESASNPRIQLDAYAKTYTQSKRIAMLLYNSLDYFRGALGGRAKAAVLVADSRDDYEPETSRFRSGVDFFVMHTKKKE